MQLRATSLSAIKASRRRAWTPVALGASLALWLDADDATTITLNGSTVSQWNDKSGKGHNISQATASAQPAYTLNGLNGRRVITFDGTDFLLSTTASVVSGNPNVLMALVVNYTGGTTGDSRAIQVGFTNLGAYAITGGTDGFSTRYNNGNEIYGAVTLSSPTIQCGTRPAGGNVAAANMFVNGTESVATSSNNPTLTPNILAGLSIGTGGINAGQNTAPLVGYIGEAIIALDSTTQTREKVEGYLAWRWGLTANLPANHPFKNIPA